MISLNETKLNVTYTYEIKKIYQNFKLVEQNSDQRKYFNIRIELLDHG